MIIYLLNIAIIIFSIWIEIIKDYILSLKYCIILPSNLFSKAECNMYLMQKSTLDDTVFYNQNLQHCYHYHLTILMKYILTNILFPFKKFILITDL
jgi:hypothetical protein